LETLFDPYILRRCLQPHPDSFFLATLPSGRHYCLWWILPAFAINRLILRKVNPRPSLIIDAGALLLTGRNVTDFDFGFSLTSRNNVTNLILPRMENSLRLLLPPISPILSLSPSVSTGTTSIRSVPR